METSNIIENCAEMFIYKNCLDMIKEMLVKGYFMHDNAFIS